MLLFCVLLPIGLGVAFTILLAGIGTVQVLLRHGSIGSIDIIGLMQMASIMAAAGFIPMVWWLVANWRNLR